MKMAKKLLLGLSVALTMAIAFVIGLVGLNNKPVSVGAPANEVLSGEISQPDNKPTGKPTSYTYDAGEVEIVKGGKNIAYNYQPDNTTNSASVKAYEYQFSSVNDEKMAVGIKSIDTTDVNVAYAWRINERLDTNQTITGQAEYPTQVLNDNGDRLYVYILVSPTNEVIPATFTQKIVWYYGKAGEVKVYKGDGTIDHTKTIVKGQPLPPPEIEVPSGSEVEGWYMDKECTILADLNAMQGAVLYPKLVDAYPEGNLPSDYIAWDSTTSSYYVKKGSSTLPTNLVIPQTYNDGTHGVANVTYIYGVSSKIGAFNGKSIESVKLPSTITTINRYAFYECKVTSLDLSVCTSLTSIGELAFDHCSKLTSIDLSGCTSLTSIDGSAFYGCSGLTSITLPSSLTSIGSYAFDRCSKLTDVYYAGTEAAFAQISIGGGNTSFTNATKHYNYTNG